MTEVSPEQEPLALAPEPPSTATTHGPEDADLSWEDKEDKDKKLDAEKTQPLSPKSAADKKYQYKEGRCGPLSPGPYTFDPNRMLVSQPLY